MKEKKNLQNGFNTKARIGGTVSINDLREKEFNNERLTDEEASALINYDRFRLAELNKAENDEQFHIRYRKLQVLANLTDFREFLEDNYAF